MYIDYSFVNSHLRKRIRSRYILSEMRYFVLLTQECKGALGTSRKQKAIHQNYAGLAVNCPSMGSGILNIWSLLGVVIYGDCRIFGRCSLAGGCMSLGVGFEGS